MTGDDLAENLRGQYSHWRLGGLHHILLLRLRLNDSAWLCLYLPALHTPSVISEPGVGVLGKRGLEDGGGICDQEVGDIGRYMSCTHETAYHGVTILAEAIV